MGYCWKKGKTDVFGFDEKITSDSKEDCLRQCLLKEGAKGCMFGILDNKNWCSTLSESMDGSTGTDDERQLRCWKFISDKGKSQY